MDQNMTLHQHVVGFMEEVAGLLANMTEDDQEACLYAIRAMVGNDRVRRHNYKVRILGGQAVDPRLGAVAFFEGVAIEDTLARAWSRNDGAEPPTGYWLRQGTS